MSSSVSSNTTEVLTQQLQQAEAEGKPVQAWFRLKPEGTRQTAPLPEQTESLARQIVERAKNRLGRGVDSISVQRQLGTFTVMAHPDIVREIMKQPEIGFAGATQVPEFGLISPVKREAVKLRTRQRKRRRAK